MIHVLTKVFGPNCPKLVYKAPDPKSHSFEIQKNFHVKLHKILHETSTYFQILHHFRQSYECFFPENGKKAHQYKSLSKFFFLVPFQICKSPLSLVWKYPLFWCAKIEIFLEQLGQISKISPFWNPLIKGFQMMQKSNNFEKVSKLADLPS